MEARLSTLAIISHKRHVISRTQRDIGPKFCYVTGGFQRITSEIASHFGRVLLCVPAQYDEECSVQNSYRENVELVALPWFSSRLELVSHLPLTMRVLQQALSRADIAYAMGPSDMGLVGLGMARLAGKPLFVSVDTDRTSRCLATNSNRAVALFKYVASKLLIDNYIKLACKNVPTFFTGDPFLGDSPCWETWVKHTLRSDEIPPLCDTCTADSTQREWRVVYAGRLAREKNVLCLLEAARCLKESGHSDMEFVLAGEGEEADRLRAATRDLGLDDRVLFAGYVPGDTLIGTRFLGANALVLPSLSERQGKVLLEAMSCGVPVVASDAGGIPSVIEHEHNGLLFDPRNPRELAARIVQLRSDNDLAARLRSNGYAYALAHTLDKTVSSIVQHVESFYACHEST